MLTGKAKVTVRRKMQESGLKPAKEDASGVYYVPREALPILYGGIALDPQKERAKLDVARVKLLDLQYAERSGQLLDALDVEAMGAAVMNAVTMKIMSLRNVAPEIRAARSDVEGSEVLENAIREALTEIASVGQIVGDVRRKARPDAASVADGDDASAEADDERVGGRRAKALAGE